MFRVWCFVGTFRSSRRTALGSAAGTTGRGTPNTKHEADARIPSPLVATDLASAG
ncbi:hypothetical protein FTUN_7262 [Frigoriglobus tundricola]|uniref:Uncharacterized protein n=1 Tax=Frigoriglobus tundricola TaxID=2774151 RepID=A0A6M5Z2A3_9BACT|nr:hypothetical protein FTUN_7262 [Frigoriglobus tundricola]